MYSFPSRDGGITARGVLNLLLRFPALNGGDVCGLCMWSRMLHSWPCKIFALPAGFHRNQDFYFFFSAIAHQRSKFLYFLFSTQESVQGVQRVLDWVQNLKVLCPKFIVSTIIGCCLLYLGH